MKRGPFFILLFGIFFAAGCAIAGPENDVIDSKVIYTDAPANVAFDASCTALTNLKFKIDQRDTKEFFVKGSYGNPSAKYAQLYADIKVTKEAMGTKIDCSTRRLGVNKALRIFPYNDADRIYKEILKILAHDELEFRKANEEKRAKEYRESQEEGLQRLHDENAANNRPGSQDDHLPGTDTAVNFQ
jgi:hypothetical protein